MLEDGRGLAVADGEKDLDDPGAAAWVGVVEAGLEVEDGLPAALEQPLFGGVGDRTGLGDEELDLALDDLAGLGDAGGETEAERDDRSEGGEAQRRHPEMVTEGSPMVEGPMAIEPTELSRFESLALALAERTNANPGLKRLQYLFHRHVNRQWVRRTVSRRLYVDNVEGLIDFEPDRGVMFAANHRSFFDQWLNMLALYETGATWPQKIYFPVRSNFFYEKLPGLMVNLMVGGMVMYPPIFRDPAKAHLNRDALDRIAELLAEPGVVVGIHPEGTRGKDPDPYQLLPAQPGVGQMALQGRPIVVPFFVNGIGNSVASAVVDSYRAGAQRDPVILVYGDPIDYSDIAGKPPRASLYLKMARRMRSAIEALIPREQEIRAACARGDIGPDDPAWLLNRSAWARRA